MTDHLQEVIRRLQNTEKRITYLPAREILAYDLEMALSFAQHNMEFRKEVIK